MTRLRLRAASLAAPFAMSMLAGCARAREAPRLPVPASTPRAVVGATEEGIASWYGDPYHGRRTHNGEIYDMNEMTAAHRTLPFGTRVLVENLSNGRRVEVRINDRGPFAKNRVIDLSRAAARQIRIIGSGTARVRLRVVRLPETAAAGFFAVQVGAFRSRSNAEHLRESLAREHGRVFIQKYDGPQGLFYRVLVGRESDVTGAATLAGKLRQWDLTPLVVRVDKDSDGNRL